MKIRFDCMQGGRFWSRLLCCLYGYHEAGVPEKSGDVQTCWVCGATRTWEPT